MISNAFYALTSTYEHFHPRTTVTSPWLWGAAMAEWLSSWLAEQEDRGSIPGLATWMFRYWLSPASKSRYGWKIAKSTLIRKTTNQPTVILYLRVPMNIYNFHTRTTITPQWFRMSTYENLWIFSSYPRTAVIMSYAFCAFWVHFNVWYFHIRTTVTPQWFRMHSSALMSTFEGVVLSSKTYRYTSVITNAFYCTYKYLWRCGTFI